MQNIEHDIKKYDQYFITKNYKKNSLNDYLAYIEKVLNTGVKLVQFRSKNLSKNQYSIVSAEIYKLCKKYKSSLIIRGLRAVSDFEYEFQLAGMNKKLNKNIETIFLMSDVENQIISSKFVKEIASLGGNIDRFATKYVVNMLKK